MKLRKGYIVVADIPQNTTQSTFFGEHPCIIYSNFLACINSTSVQIIPLTSQVDKKAQTGSHVLIPKGIGNLRETSIVLTEQLITVDINILKYTIGQLPIEWIRRVDKALSFQLNLNRNYNLEFAFNMLTSIKKLDNITVKYKECNVEEDEDDKELRRALINNLKDFCYQNSINFERLCLEGGLINV